MHTSTFVTFKKCCDQQNVVLAGESVVQPFSHYITLFKTAIYAVIQFLFYSQLHHINKGP